MSTHVPQCDPPPGEDVSIGKGALMSSTLTSGWWDLLKWGGNRVKKTSTHLESRWL